MKKILFSLLTISSLAMVSCGGGEEKKEEKSADSTAKVEEPKAPVCTYSYQHDSTRVEWIAYKFTEKAGVKGRFDSTEVTGTGDADTMQNVFKNAAFKIYTASTETNDKGRNEKIVKFVFGKMKSTSEITGSVKSINADGSMFTISIKMNEIEKDVEVPATWEGEKVTLKADINLEDWNGQESVKAITEACKKNHTGTDGITKVWPDVTIIISTTLHKTCAE
ncbi:MAG: YceI family protein [Flavobacteriales bacterium]|nr:YceI family protein [Flavobacteriales bacterium]